MKNKIFKKQKDFTDQKKHKIFSGGFTLVETLIAILILTLSVGALLSLASGGFYSVKYSRNQIVANNLLQESIEYIRNSRDSAIEQGYTWDTWQQNILSVNTDGDPTGTGMDGCLNNKTGCFIDPYSDDRKIKECQSGVCPYVQYYPDNSFYGYLSKYPFAINTEPYETSFVRKIVITTSGQTSDQLVVNATITWENGSNIRTLSQKTLITNWK